MQRKIVIAVAVIVATIILMIIGWFIGEQLFPNTFIVCDYYGSIITYTVRFGQINGSTMGITPGVKPLTINLDGIHDTKVAVKEIEKQVREQGGNIISIMS